MWNLEAWRDRRQRKRIQVHRIIEQCDEIEFCQRKRMTRYILSRCIGPDVHLTEMPATATLTSVHPYRLVQLTLQLTRYFYLYVT